MQHPEWILILDFGSQYTQLIARRLREFNVYCEIYPYNHNLEDFSSHKPNGVVLSGGPRSVYDTDAPHLNKTIFDWNIPVLGICYGLQILSHTEIPGSVAKAERREFGRAELIIDDENNALFKNIPHHSQVWMSHSDSIVALPEGFQITATTESIPIAAFKKTTTDTHPLFGLQFHPEVYHSTQGKLIIKNFLAADIKNFFLVLNKKHQSWEEQIKNSILEILDLLTVMLMRKVQ